MASDFNETETFDEYNPHPYQGGYDIAATYGRPLPPSSAICYPISPPPSSPPASELLRDAADRQGEPERRAPREDEEPRGGSDSAAGGSGCGYGIDGFGGFGGGSSPGEAGAFPQVFGYWPFSAAQEFEWSHEGWGRAEPDILNCAADYLFAYLPAYGEKRDESHNYGNLNYAYERHHRQEPLVIQVSPHEPSWCGDPSYHEDYQEEACTDSGYAFDYGRDSTELAHSEVVCVGSSWSPTSYHEDCSRQVYPQSEYPYTYEVGYNEQPPSVQREQVEHPWSHKPSFSEFYENHVPPQPADAYTYGSKLYEQPVDMFDFVEKSWYQMLNNNESGEINSYPQSKTHEDSWSRSEQQSYFPFCKYSDYD